jgi:hypothetical protein
VGSESSHTFEKDLMNQYGIDYTGSWEEAQKKL